MADVMHRPSMRSFPPPMSADGWRATTSHLALHPSLFHPACAGRHDHRDHVPVLAGAGKQARLRFAPPAAQGSQPGVERAATPGNFFLFRPPVEPDTLLTFVKRASGWWCNSAVWPSYLCRLVAFRECQYC